MRKHFFILLLFSLTVSALFAQNKVTLPPSTGIWTWGKIEYSAKLDSMLPSNDLKKAIQYGKLIDTLQLQSAIENTLKSFEQMGYPFASISFDSIKLNSENKSVNAILVFNPHQLILFDSLSIAGNKEISGLYLRNYLSIKPNSIYDERKVTAIQNRIEELTFIRLNKPTQLYFVNSKAKVVLSIEKRNANKFDGLIGIQPSSNNQKTAIIGQAQLYLINVIKKGEKINIDFRSQANNTRDIKLYANYPYVFSSNFGIDVNLDLRRQDTTFSTFGRGIGLQYLFSGNNQIRFIYRVDESNLLSVKKYEKATVLPDNIDIKKYSYGINILFEKLDYRVNPKKGFSVQATSLIGNRIVNKNSSIADSLYNGIDLKSTQIQIHLGLKKYFNVYGKNVLMMSVNSKLISSDQLFNNELLRFGGINDLRGFDEESVLASFFTIGTVEYRYLFDRNSFFRLFYDQAYFQNKILDTNNNANGFGLGVQMQTNAGMLQLNYALGSQNNSGISFQSGKIHFGIINYF